MVLRVISDLALLVLAAPVLLAAVAVLAAARPGAHPAVVERLGVLATWAGVTVAAVAGAVVAAQGTVRSATHGWGAVAASVRLDALSTVMLAMVALLAVVIWRYSCTYLDGDDRKGVFLGRLAAAVACVEVLVLAGHLTLLVAAWVAASLTLHALLVFRRHRRRAVLAARKKFVIARVGDVALVTAVVLLVRHFGTGDLQAVMDGTRALVADAAGVPAGLQAAAVLLAVAAVLKSAQFPFHGWLVEVMDTPTPVSALLHAGILNAGPFLAIRMAYVLEASPAATLLLIVVGGATAVIGSIALLTQPTVKVVLGWSSAAHMGFMLMVCGIGLYPAALLHLVAHSFYKAHAFLSSGSVVDEARAAGVRTPTRLGSPVRLAGSAAVALALYGALAVLWGIDLLHHPALLVVGALLVLGTTQIVAPTLDTRGAAGAVLRATGLALAVTVAFFVLEAGAHHLLAAVTPKEPGRSAWHLGAAAALVAVSAVVVAYQLVEPARPSGARRRAVAVHLRNGLYANAVLDRLLGALRVPAR